MLGWVVILLILSCFLWDFYKIFPDFEKIATAQRVVKKVLKLRVENSTWRSEMKFREKEIIERINKFYNEERVKQIRFSS